MHTSYVPQESYSKFRRSVLRRGGAIVVSAPVDNMGQAGYHVTYVNAVR